MTTEDGRSRGPLTVLYDADCGICRLTALALLRLDWRHRLDLVPLQSFVAEPAAGAPSRDAMLAELHVRDAGGHWWRGGAATVRVAASLPLLMPVALAARIPGMTFVIDRAYRFIANRRAQISAALGLQRCATRLRPSSLE